MFPVLPLELEWVACPSCGGSDYSWLTQTRDYDYTTTDMEFQIVRCFFCGLVYMNPRPKLTEIDKIYPSEYSAYSFSRISNPIIRNARTFMQKRKALKILKHIHGDNSSYRIVDVGCGSPALLELLRDASESPLILYGNDFNSDVLKSIQDSGFIPLPGAFEKIEWERNYFDAIIMNQVIEHLFDIPGTLKKSFDLLKPNGILYMETPSEEGIDAKFFRKNHWGGYHVPRHLQIFSSETIRHTLSRFGFSIVRLEYLPSPNFWTSSCRNFLFRLGVPYELTKRMSYKNVLCMSLFTSIDLLTRMFHPTSNMRVIAKKQ